MGGKSLSKDFTQGNIARQLFFFAIPFMASNALQVLYSTIDMIIVGEFVGTPGLSAVSQSSQIVNFATMVCLGFSNAGQVLLAQALGAKKRKEMNDIIGTLFTFITVVALIFTFAMLCMQGWILDTMKIPKNRMIWQGIISSFVPADLSLRPAIIWFPRFFAEWETRNGRFFSLVSRPLSISCLISCLPAFLVGVLQVPHGRR